MVLKKMKISDIHHHTTKPELYEEGNAIMWTDEHISKQLLRVHLNPEVDLASRKAESIKRTVDWILSNVAGNQLQILDLGCGPGLYSEQMAEKGHHVSGVDYSWNSINHARESAKKKKLDITYLNENYLKLELEENSFDLVILIFTDFGPLLPDERKQLLETVKKVLKPGGVFIFDVLNDKNIENKVTPKSWETSNQGFWKNESYLALSESYIYEDEKVILYQHLILDEQDNLQVYRFWTHCFSHSDLSHILYDYGFNEITFSEDILPVGSLWSGDNVTFCKAAVKK